MAVGWYWKWRRVCHMITSFCFFLKVLRGILRITFIPLHAISDWILHWMVSLQCVRILRFEISPFSIAVWGTYCVGTSNCPLLRKLGLFAQIQLLLHSQATGFHLQLKCCNIIVVSFLFFQLIKLLLRRHGRVMRTTSWSVVPLAMFKSQVCSSILNYLLIISCIYAVNYLFSALYAYQL